MKILTDFMSLEHGTEYTQTDLKGRFVDAMIKANRNNPAWPKEQVRRVIDRFYIGSEIVQKRKFGNDNILRYDWIKDSQGPTLSERTQDFVEYANTCVDQVYENDADAPDGIVHVTCSGYTLPSPIQRLVSQKNWRDVSLIHSYHMGCYGAFPGIKIASGMRAHRDKPNHRVDVVHTELFTPYFDAEKLDPSSIVAFSLFGDGAIKYSVMHADSSAYKTGLKILSAHEEIIQDSLHDMSWGISDRKFSVFLSGKIPEKIGQGILQFVQRLCEKGGMDFQSQKDDFEYAIHPGGTAILREVAQNLSIDSEQLANSFDLLRARGNMSSVCVPYLLKDIIENPVVKEGTKILALGFGPGLTATGLILEKVSGGRYHA